MVGEIKYAIKRELPKGSERDAYVKRRFMYCKNLSDAILFPTMHGALVYVANTPLDIDHTFNGDRWMIVKVRKQISYAEEN